MKKFVFFSRKFNLPFLKTIDYVLPSIMWKLNEHINDDGEKLFSTAILSIFTKLKTYLRLKQLFFAVSQCGGFVENFAEKMFDHTFSVSDLWVNLFLFQSFEYSSHIY